VTTDSKALAKRETTILIKDTPGAQKALVSRFGDKEFSTALTVSHFIAVCNTYGLNPWMGQITPFHGRPYIQHDGWMSLINREAPGQLVGIDARPATDAEYKQFRVAESAYFAIATATRRYPGGNSVSLTRRALVQTKEVEGGQGYKPIEIEPWEMAEKRARVRVLRSLFNDCMAKVGVPTPSVDTQTGEVLEGEVVQANGTDWSRLWVTASERGMEKADVHEHFGVPADDGALKDYAQARVKQTGKPLQQVVQDMADEVGGLGQDEPAPPDDGQQPEPEAVGERFDREQAEAGMAQGSEPADEGLA